MVSGESLSEGAKACAAAELGRTIIKTAAKKPRVILPGRRADRQGRCPVKLWAVTFRVAGFSEVRHMHPPRKHKDSLALRKSAITSVNDVIRRSLTCEWKQGKHNRLVRGTSLCRVQQ